MRRKLKTSTPLHIGIIHASYATCKIITIHLTLVVFYKISWCCKLLHIKVDHERNYMSVP